LSQGRAAPSPRQASSQTMATRSQSHGRRDPSSDSESTEEIGRPLRVAHPGRRGVLRRSTG
jgi:hypothetical protein